MDGGSQVPRNVGSARREWPFAVFFEKTHDTKMTLGELFDGGMEDGLKERGRQSVRPREGGLIMKCDVAMKEGAVGIVSPRKSRKEGKKERRDGRREGGKE